MKEIMIIIRPKMYFPTKEALDEAGFYAMTIRDVIGRGKTPVRYDFDGDGDVIHRFAAKKMINMYVRDEDVDRLVETVVKVNETNHAGDGKIFIMAAEDAVRVRTGENGIEAIV